ncbi:hypothetical protein DDB_G0275729 [Dictyostelium discoideum AX4]|uniref:Uncharacterized protein n=1 Tax=Dictyostelium discoideum TaxID=44689 RepID=Q553M3_DICDI|nr:hypothetical protein DDB_G0275729 [Dictyostelium discoideum AX4]EAL69615.1 hypothetical protein DDB_G0275729 [Dictyostelium discoideum AX4]|eukprot:XP_643570.1 hypothetical protein DDB_G0275729 [Dictyostelium discoideum AX4]
MYGLKKKISSLFKPQQSHQPSSSPLSPVQQLFKINYSFNCVTL